MKKLGIGKKEKSGDAVSEESKRSHLFSSRSKNKSPAPSANPYAVPQNNSQDPYAAKDPYAARPPPSVASGSTYGGMGSPAYPDSGRASIATQPPTYERGGYPAPPDQSIRNAKSPVPPGGYGGSQPPQASRFNNSPYAGNQSGYGSDPYGAPKPDPYGAPKSDPYGAPKPAPDYGASRQGGYGGMSTADPVQDERKNELFGGAKQRIEERQQHPQTQLPPEEQQSGGSYGASGVPDSLDSAYGGTYQERQLTAEEQEEEDVSATKDQIKALKREDVSSTRNALRIAAQAEETGRATLERLAAQGERIHNTEKVI